MKSDKPRPILMGLIRDVDAIIDEMDRRGYPEHEIRALVRVYAEHRLRGRRRPPELPPGRERTLEDEESIEA